MANEEERLNLSERERDRLKVLHEVEKGQLKQREAAAQLKMSERGFRKLLQRYRAKKDRAVVHGLRGRVSRRRLDGRTAARAVAAVKRDYADFGPTLAAEYLARERKIELSRETLRKLLISDGHWKPKKRQVKAVHVWRQRRSCRGELVQWDTSVHAWLEDRGPARMYLIALIDDATSRLFARFVVADSTEHHMRVWGIICLATAGHRRFIPTRQVCSSRRWRRAGRKKSRDQRQKRRWGVHCGS